MSAVPSPHAAPKALLFDVNETLISLQPLADAMVQVGLKADLLELWFAKVLRDGIAGAAAGSLASFKDIGVYHTKLLLAAAKPAVNDHTEAAETVLAAFNRVDLYDDVAPALAEIRACNMKVATMTNGSVDITKGALQKGRLDPYVHVNKMMDVTQAGTWKPHAKCYHFAAQQLGLEPSEVMLVAVHPWDCNGAMQAGLQAAYLDRNSIPFPPFFTQPTLTSTSMSDLVDQLQHMQRSSKKRGPDDADPYKSLDWVK
ncbi:hypothetical protein WJX74_003087 [Apatococcus lobatus]|uniref:Haloacid dehalogenase n=1 Tax=Apatococcus lobatus TaxID=904363 RepID=A0AAW1RJG7_9CHLO